MEEFTPAFFDAASLAWKANKIPIGEGSYRYKKDIFQENPVVEKGKSDLVRRSLRIASRIVCAEKS